MSLRARVSLVVAVSLVGATLSTVLQSPAVAISVPVTRAGSMQLTSAQAARLPFIASHIVFSWSGGEGTGIRYRTVDQLGRPSQWTLAPEDHDIVERGRHWSGVLSVNRTATVQWRPVEPRDLRVKDVRLEYMNTVDGPRRTVVIPALAHAAASTPQIITRAEWGADESIKSTGGSCTRRFFPVQQLFVHHTAGTNYDTNPKATMRAIYHYHTVSRGWCDIGYNFVIAPDGSIFEGRWARKYAPWETHDSENKRGHAVAGAHVSGYNSGSVGISLMGNYSQVNPSPAMRRSLAELLAWEVDRHDLSPRGRHLYRNPDSGSTRRLPFIAGHRDAGQTECPGNFTYKAMGDIRRDTAAVMGDGKLNSTLSLASDAGEIGYGDQVNIGGTLTDQNGTALAGQAVTVYQREAGAGWKRHSSVTTGVDGTYAFTLAPEKNVRLRAVYDGNEEVWGAESPLARIDVRPSVTFAPEEGRPALDGSYTYPEGTTEISFVGAVAPAHPGGTVILSFYSVDETGAQTLIEKPRLRLDDSSAYRYDFQVPGPGEYSAAAMTQRHRDHARGDSEPIAFRVE